MGQFFWATLMAAADRSAETPAGGAKTAIFIGVFFLAVIAVLIWWLRR